METSSTQTPQVFRSNRGRNLTLVATRQTKTTESLEKEVSSLKAKIQGYQAREEALNAKEKELREIMATVRTAFGILSGKSVVMLSMLASITGFGFAVMEPTGLRILAASLLTVIVFLPALWADARRN